jgi:hypothetical protein
MADNKKEQECAELHRIVVREDVLRCAIAAIVAEIKEAAE